MIGLDEYRCEGCNRLLFRGKIRWPSIVEHRCKCKMVTMVAPEPEQQVTNWDQDEVSGANWEPDGVGGWLVGDSARLTASPATG